MEIKRKALLKSVDLDFLPVGQGVNVELAVVRRVFQCGGEKRRRGRGYPTHMAAGYPGGVAVRFECELVAGGF